MNKIIFDTFNFESKLLEQRIKIWEQIRRNHLDLKPFKIYKRKYEKWEHQLLEYDNIISFLYNQKLINYDQFYESIKEFLISNKNR